MAKRCSRCKHLKDNDQFYSRSDKPHLLQSHCKQCVINKAHGYIQRNLEVKKVKDKIYHLKNREKRLRYAREYNRNKRTVTSAKLKLRYHNDLDFRLQTNLRNRVRMALKRNSKSESTAALLGCSTVEVKSYLQALFKDGMNWANYGEWQVDHIKPCSLFDLSCPDQQKECFNYKNLQPLWEAENRTKSNNLKEKEVYHR